MWDEFYLLDLGIGIGKKFGMTDERVGMVWMMSSRKKKDGWLDAGAADGEDAQCVRVLVPLGGTVQVDL